MTTGIIFQHNTDMDRTEAAQKAIEAAGGPGGLARRLAPDADDEQIRKMTGRIRKWARNGVPAGFALHVQAVTGVSAMALCPAMFPDKAA